MKVKTMTFSCAFANLKKRILFASLAMVGAAAALPAMTHHSIADEFSSMIQVQKSKNGSDHAARLGVNKSLVIHTKSDVADILVANPEVASAVARTPRRIYVLAGKEPGQTNIFLFKSNGQPIATVDLTVAVDTTSLTRTIEQVLPGSQVNIASMGNGIVLSGSVRSPLAAKQAYEMAVQFMGNEELVTSMLGSGTEDQVMLKVVIAEVSREAAKQLGVDLSATGTSLTALTDNSFELAGAPLSQAAATLAGSIGGFQIEARLRAMEQHNVARLLAEPTLTAVSGESADFLVGGEFPIPVAQEDGVITVDYKRFGVQLSFTPTVLSSGRISMKIRTEVSSIANIGAFSLNNNLTIPGLQSRSAETSIELPSGGSLAIAGLIQDDVKRSMSNVPGIASIPILGNLFRSKDYERSQTELAIFVTPYLVKPVSANALTSPRAIIKKPGNATDYLMNQLGGNYNSSSGRPTGQYRGQFGFNYQ